MSHSKKSNPDIIAKSLLLCLVVVGLVIGLLSVLSSRAAISFTFPTSRDMYKWPFSRYSPTNIPIGKNANYQPATINGNEYTYVTADFDIIYYNPNAPVQDVFLNTASWSGRPRCGAEGGVLYKAKIPADFMIPGGGGQDNSHGNTPNHSSSLLDENNRVVESQPLSHCPGGPFVSQYMWDNGPNGRYDLTGDNFFGSHGGSGISGAGLALKMGELMPGKPVFHAIGLELYAQLDYSCSGGCFRWPAPASDSYASGGYQGSNPKVKPGSLLALKPGQSESLGLTSEPGKLLAWTLENYGAYIVDDAAWPTIQIPVEFSPNGDFTQQFKSTWGMDFEGGVSNDWHKDLQKMMTALSVVDNNASNARGGGGDPLMCYAPPFSNGTDGLSTNPNGSVTEPTNCNGGNPTVTPTVTPTIQPGNAKYDLDKNGEIGIGDLTLLIKDYPRGTNPAVQNSPADFNNSGVVDISDLSTLVSRWGIQV